MKTTAGTHCRNCTNPVSGDYCSTCGQKVHFDSEPTLHDLIHELTHEFLHLDGKIFRTLKVLYSKPGELTAELLRGRRASYIGPIRLYLAVSVVLFLLGSLFPSPPPQPKESTEVVTADEADSTVDKVLISIAPREQTAKVEKFNKDHPGQLQEFATKSNAKIFFILVPLFALLLRLSYLRQRKKYVPFLYFSLHYHAFVFGLGCLLFPLLLIQKYLGLPLLQAGQYVWYLASLVYLVLAIRKVWGGSLARTLLRVTFVMGAYVMCFFLTILIFVLTYVNLHA